MNLETKNTLEPCAPIVMRMMGHSEFWMPTLTASVYSGRSVTAPSAMNIVMR